jgi:hypothetical protein
VSECAEIIGALAAINTQERQMADLIVRAFARPKSRNAP